MNPINHDLLQEDADAMRVNALRRAGWTAAIGCLYLSFSVVKPRSGAQTGTANSEIALQDTERSLDSAAPLSERDKTAGCNALGHS